MFFKSVLTATHLLLTCGVAAAQPMSKAEATGCVKEGMTAFFEGGDIISLLDFNLLFERSGIDIRQKSAAIEVIRQRAVKNVGRFHIPSKDNRWPVVSTKESSTTGYTIVYGTIRGTEKLVDDKGNLTGEVKGFRHKFTVWIRKTADNQCQFAVVDFEGVWKLGEWLKQNL